ncbi:MAG TPA: V-type ATPase subunit [Gammaproteobacteria bacterium]|nr:V-type ATPase subunit [Gammaproteobacteria bacterium]
MSAAARFAYLDARVSVLAGRLLSPAAMARFVEVPPDEHGEDFQTLGLPFRAEQVPENPMDLEQALVSLLVKEAGVLARPLTGAARDMLRYWLRRFEIVNLKVVMRAIMEGQSVEDIHARLLDLGAMSALPLDTMLHAEDTAELLRRLEHSVYAGMVRQARSTYEEQGGLFSVESALDREYFTGLAKRANALPSEAGRDLRRLVGVLIDQVNLVWLLRYRHVYGLDPAHAYYLLAPMGRYLDSRRLLALVQLGSVEEVVQALTPPFAEPLQGLTTIDAVEAALNRETERIAHIVLGFTTFNLGRPCAYLLLRERQLWRIQAALKGQRLALAPDTIRRAMRITTKAPAGRRGQED